jgi:3-methyladenine DNA glycosylase/8-oxoguanine DNA glycosylase
LKVFVFNWFGYGFNRALFLQEAEMAQLLLTRLNPEPRDPAAYAYQRTVLANTEKGKELLLSQALFAQWVVLSQKYQYRIASDWEEISSYSLDLDSAYRHLFDRTFGVLPEKLQNRLLISMPLIYGGIINHSDQTPSLIDFEAINSKLLLSEYY